MAANRTAILTGSFAVLLAAFAITPAAATEGECAAIGKLIPYCGLPNAEDLEVLPGGEGLLASDLRIKRTDHGIASDAGTIKWLDPKTRIVTVLYPATTAPTARADWGDPACTGEIGAQLLPHGMHLSRRADGAWQLLAVNHGGRESIEFFELSRAGGQWALAWRGCAVPTGQNHLNDVVGLPDGGFLVTTMHQGGNGDLKEMRARAARGEPTGFLWRWSRAGGFVKQPGSDSAMPNGVQIDARHRYAYIDSASRGGAVLKLDLARGTIVGSVAVAKPDNASWAADGRLLVTGITAQASSDGCFVNPGAVCDAPFDVFAIDTRTMRAERIFAQAGPPMGAGTVAVQYGADLMIGTFAGDRIMAAQGLFAPKRR